jgi:DNA (cytosine-5)-methyltransferase 1
MKNKLTFIDLYAGIGGIRFAFEMAGAKCIFSSEWNKYSQLTYNALHGETPLGDITNISHDEIPEHTILTAGFPCQPFSLAGVSKKNSLGRLHGFEDPTQGTEFFKIKEIIRVKQPEAFLLENVKNLKSHDKGNTFKIIEDTLDTLGYDFEYKILDSSNWVPQHRERIYIVGFRKDLSLKESITDVFPLSPQKRAIDLTDVLESDEDIKNKYGDKYTVTPGTWEALKRHKNHHAQKGNGFGYALIEPPYQGKITRTISARYHKDGAEILISQGSNKRPRRLTPLEAYRLQGFPKEFESLFTDATKKPVSDLQLYKQLGNSVSVPVLSAIAEGLVKTLKLRLNKKKAKKTQLKLELIDD